MNPALFQMLDISTLKERGKGFVIACACMCTHTHTHTHEKKLEKQYRDGAFTRTTDPAPHPWLFVQWPTASMIFFLSFNFSLEK